jgi:hypothetical protein
VAGRTGLDYPGFIPFPWSYLMDVLMAVYTLNVIDEVDTCIMFGPFFFMASMTGDWLSVDFCTFGCVSIDIGNVPVTTITRVDPVDGLSEFFFVYFIPVASKAFGVVDNLFSAFPDFWWLDYPWTLFFRSGACRPKKSKVQKKEARDNEKKEN